jgi:hypothetical protein
LRFCRILRGLAVGQHRISTEWRPYWELEIDLLGKTFTVVLNEARTRLICSSIHRQDWAQCGGSPTTELSLEDIDRAVA